jgi:hypothetical protein
MRIVWVQQLRQGIVFFPAELIKTVSQIFAERDRTGEAANKDDFLIGVSRTDAWGEKQGF